MRSSNQSQFARNASVHKPRSVFNRPSGYKTTMDSGLLVPIYCDEVLPGDTFNVRMTAFARLSTPIVPFMDNAYLETFWFYCPNRLLWTNFVKQMGEQDNPDDSTDFLTPVITWHTDANTPMGLWDYFGHALATSPWGTAPVVTALHFRMYNKIWNEWFRDQDLQDSLTVPTGDGPDAYNTYYAVRRINKYHDYFTSCRPEPQKGPAVEVPIGGTAPISASGDITVVTNSQRPTWTTTGTGNQLTNVQMGFQTTATPQLFNTASGVNAASSTFTTQAWGNQTGMKIAEATLESTLSVDGTDFVGPTLNEFREMATIQQMYELDMRGGTRYNEGLYSHFGVVNPDNRVNRTLFLGSGKSYVNITQVAQTSSTDAETPQGNLAAFGTVSAHGHGFFQSFSEHGYIIGLAAVRADLSYQQNINRMFKRRTRFDYYDPIFANLGEQAVLNEEVWFSGTAATDAAVFGYQERWAEYRYKPSLITGLLRNQVTYPAAGLSIWTLSQTFTATPELGSTFIEENAPFDRVIAVPSEPQFIFDSYIENRTTRVMPVRSIPGLTRI